MRQSQSKRRKKSWIFWVTAIILSVWTFSLNEGLTNLVVLNTEVQKERIPPKVQYVKDKNGKRTIQKTKKYSKVIFYIHIHKSAGSWMCKQAYRNRMSAAYETNCNVQQIGEKDSIPSLVDFANKTFYDFIATEKEMYDNVTPEVYDYIVTIRKSKNRYYSHYRMVLRNKDKKKDKRDDDYEQDSLWLWSGGLSIDEDQEHPMKKLQQKVARDKLRQQQQKEQKALEKQQKKSPYQPLQDFKTWSEGQPDNWNVRILCGRKCKSKYKFQITPELFRYTLQRLTVFKHILFVEQLDESYNRFAANYGWKQVENSNVGKKVNYPVSDMEQAQWDPMMSALDDALYEFATRLYNNQSSILWDGFSNQNQVEHYFEFGPLVNCTDICCGQCSPY